MSENDQIKMEPLLPWEEQKHGYVDWVQQSRDLDTPPQEIRDMLATCKDNHD